MSRRIGAYELLERIGDGATSDVYRARHTTLDRAAAVKVLLPRLTASGPARRMFLRESRLVARLDHPNVVRVYEAGEHEDALYIAMELVTGLDLKSLLEARGRLSVAETLDMARQVASALDAAHAEGLVHRDVKPSNILLADDGSGRVLLTDFGLTTARDSQTRVSGTGQLVGSIPYMPPEQLEGRQVTPRSDVYSLACVVYECLVGNPPFPRDSDVQVLWAHVRDAPHRPSQTDPALRALDRAVLHGLAKSPDERPATATELVEYLSGARRYGRRRPGPHLARSAPRRYVASAAGVALLAAGLTYLGTTSPSPDASPARSGTTIGAGGGQSHPHDGGLPTGNVDEPLARSVDAASPVSPESLPDSVSPLTPAPTGRVTLPSAVAGRAPGALRARIESLPYDSSPVADCVAGTPEQVGCVELETRAGESSIHVAIRDQTRLPVRAWIRQDVDRDGDFDGDWIEICAQTGRPVPVRPGAIISISLETGRCGSEGNSVPTSGLVTVAVFGQQ